MKIREFNLINYNLVKYQVYNLNNICLKMDGVSKYLRQSLKIIYLYNLKKKRILFVGFSNNKFLITKLNQSCVSTEMLLNINVSCYDLIVFNGTKYEDNIILKNLTSLKIPLILFGTCNEKHYGVSGTFKNKNILNFIFFLFFVILTKNRKIIQNL